MTYSNVPGGFGASQPSQPNYGPQPQQPLQQVQPGYPQAGPGGGGPSIATITKIVVIAFGVLSFFLGFAPYVKDDGTDAFGNGEDSMNFFANVGVGVGTVGLALLLLAALVAGFGMLPKQPGNEALVAALSVGGFLTLLFLLICLVDGVEAGIGLILVLIVSFLQAAVAIAALLVAAEVIKPRPPAPYGGYYQQGGYPQPGTYGQPGLGAPPQQPSYGVPQSPGYGAPGYPQQ